MEPTDLQLDWLQENYRVRWQQREPAVLADAFMHRFRKAVSPAWIQDVIDRLGWPPQRDAGKPLLTWAEHRYLARIAQQHTREKCAALLNFRFGTGYTAAQLKHYIGDTQKRGGGLPYVLHMGNDGRFAKGSIPPNKGKPGEERIHHYGVRGGRARKPEIHVIVEGRNPYRPTENTYTRPKRLVVWEAARGPVPDGFNIIQIDGDWRNCELDNLACLSDAELARLNRDFSARKFPGDRESRRTAVLAAQLKQAAHDAAFAPRRRSRCPDNATASL